MITSRKISQIDVFAGSPWEVASVKRLLNAAYIEVSMKVLTVFYYPYLVSVIQPLCVL